ncbi:MAG: hypothetical protein QCI82_00135 [Candidatus Thermoplasmatota archaeon]|nr:hypothetical protein [Candidatus Thermoplasmatota archaeon]
MKGLLTIRLGDKEKGSIALASRLTGIPASKMLYPFIEEALRTNLGASLLFMIDRSAPFNRNHFQKFIGELRSADPHAGDNVSGTETVDHYGISPRLLLDSIWAMREIGLQQRLEQAMDGVQISPELDYIDIVFLSRLSRDLGERYIISGLPLDRLDARGATRLFFSLMTEAFYRHNARGTIKTLNTRWYGNQDLIAKLVEEMASRYERKYPARVVEAIEVNEASTVVAPKRPIKKRPVKAPVKTAAADK